MVCLRPKKVGELAVSTKSSMALDSALTLSPSLSLTPTHAVISPAMDSASRPRVKNKAAAPVQISAEQLLREAVSHQETQLRAPTTRFADLEELREYQGRKRKDFEDYLRRNRQNVNNFTRYATWELEQREFARGTCRYKGPTRPES
jgi:monoamine oxidase